MPVIPGCAGGLASKTHDVLTPEGDFRLPAIRLHATFRGMNTNDLFKPLDICGKLRLPNRLVMAPMTTTSGETDGRLSQQEIDYLVRRAESGVGTIMSPACYCHPSGYAFDRQIGCHTDGMLSRMTELVSRVRQHGAVSILQIHHGGNAAREQFTGQP
ncbi:hypothetical protein GF377_05205, partial [candidate division GN15 bacterium]|nr:hypothetical protein [candidate division GN15 bacterium]